MSSLLIPRTLTCSGPSSWGRSLSRSVAQQHTLFSQRQRHPQSHDTAACAVQSMTATPTVPWCSSMQYLINHCNTHCPKMQHHTLFNPRLQHPLSWCIATPTVPWCSNACCSIHHCNTHCPMMQQCALFNPSLQHPLSTDPAAHTVQSMTEIPLSHDAAVCTIQSIIATPTIPWCSSAHYSIHDCNTHCPLIQQHTLFNQWLKSHCPIMQQHALFNRALQHPLSQDAAVTPVTPHMNVFMTVRTIQSMIATPTIPSCSSARYSICDCNTHCPMMQQCTLFSLWLQHPLSHDAAVHAIQSVIATPTVPWCSSRHCNRCCRCEVCMTGDNAVKCVWQVSLIWSVCNRCYWYEVCVTGATNVKCVWHVLLIWHV